MGYGLWIDISETILAPLLDRRGAEIVHNP